MSKTQRLRTREVLYEDASGVVVRAKDSSGHKVQVRKPKADVAGLGFAAVEQVAWQVAIERLRSIRHPSLLRVVSGGSDSSDGRPFIGAKIEEAESLAQKIRSGPLPIELVTALLSQALEVSELLSHLLADDGIWIETDIQSIQITEKSMEPCFLFWPSPLKSMHSGRQQSFKDLIDLTECVLSRGGQQVDEREGGHLQMWLKWLKEVADKASVREAREMLAAAIGVEPPEPIEKLVEACLRKPGLLDRLPKLPPVFYKWQAPKMPLFVLLSVMFVVQSMIGWFIVRIINNSIDEELQRLNAGYTESPYTVDRDPRRRAERGSRPLNFD